MRAQLVGCGCGRSSVVERQLPKLYVVGSIPIARSRFLKQLTTISVDLLSRKSEQKRNFREQKGRLATKSSEKVPSYVHPMFWLNAAALILRRPPRAGL